MMTTKTSFPNGTVTGLYGHDKRFFTSWDSTVPTVLPMTYGNRMPNRFQLVGWIFYSLFQLS
jgi:hypothetical protein